MSPSRLPEDAGGHDGDEGLRRLARADLAWERRRAARRFLTTLVAFASIFPWLRSLGPSALVPRAIVDVGVAGWVTLALVTLCVRCDEWVSARERRRQVERISAAARDRRVG